MNIDVEDLVGKPYKDHGRGPDGYDCWGLAIEVEKRMGIELPDFEYTDIAGLMALEAKKIIEAGRAVKVEEPVPGALCLFKNFKGAATHVGCYLGDDLFIHCHSIRGVRIERFSPHRITAVGVYIWQK